MKALPCCVLLAVMALGAAQFWQGATVDVEPHDCGRGAWWEGSEKACVDHVPKYVDCETARKALTGEQHLVSFEIETPDGGGGVVAVVDVRAWVTADMIAEACDGE